MSPARIMINYEEDKEVVIPRIFAGLIEETQDLYILTIGIHGVLYGVPTKGHHEGNLFCHSVLLEIWRVRIVNSPNLQQDGMAEEIAFMVSLCWDTVQNAVYTQIMYKSCVSSMSPAKMRGITTSLSSS
jgi:hypothetical protein